MANAGIDFSNVKLGGGDETALLLPEDPDKVCAELRTEMLERAKADIGIIINDSHGRAFRNGTVGVAIGASGLSALADLRGSPISTDADCEIRQVIGRRDRLRSLSANGSGCRRTPHYSGTGY